MVKKTNKIIKTVNRYLELLMASGINIKAAYMFGSTARNSANPDSDIDVAIVSPNVTGNPEKDTKMFWRMTRLVDSRIEPVYFSPDEFLDFIPLVWEIKNNGIRVY
ncbi:MAG: nucleotidyltransferase domain-containing protein [Candidatus Hydrogenedentota bacterium]